MRVELQYGPIEQGSTVFAKSSLRDYLLSIDDGHDAAEPKCETAKNADPAAVEARRHYLAQFELFKHFPSLRSDLPVRMLWPWRKLIWSYAWIGPAGTVTGIHADTSDNLLVQIYGRKRVLLFQPGPDDVMYLSDK